MSRGDYRNVVFRDTGAEVFGVSSRLITEVHLTRLITEVHLN